MNFRPKAQSVAFFHNRFGNDFGTDSDIVIVFSAFFDVGLPFIRIPNRPRH